MFEGWLPAGAGCKCISSPSPQGKSTAVNLCPRHLSLDNTNSFSKSSAVAVDQMH